MSLISELLKENAAELTNTALEASSRGLTDAPFADDVNQEEGSEFFDLKDVALAPLRGIEGFAQSIYNLGDFALGDALPNWDTRLLGKSESMVGGFVEGTTQFLTGFIPVGGLLGKAGQAVSIGSKLAKAGSGVQKAASIGKQALQGAVTDFIAFDGQDERLSNLMQSVPALQNPISEYLQANKDDNEIEGRFKNVVEGLFLEAGQQALAPVFFNGVKAMKQFKGNVDAGMAPEEAAKVAGNALEQVSGKELKTIAAPPIFEPAIETPVGAGMVIEPQKATYPEVKPIEQPLEVDPATGEPQKIKGGELAIDTVVSDLLRNARSPKEIGDALGRLSELTDYTKVPFESPEELLKNGRADYASLGLNPDDFDTLLKSSSPEDFKKIRLQQYYLKKETWKAGEAWIASAKAAADKTGDDLLEAEAKMHDFGVKYQDFLAVYSQYGTGASYTMLDRKLGKGLTDALDDGKGRKTVVDTFNPDIENIVKEVETINPDAPSIPMEPKDTVEEVAAGATKTKKVPTAKVKTPEDLAKSYEDKIAKLEGDLAVERKLAFTATDAKDYKVTVDEEGVPLPVKTPKEKTPKQRFLEETIASYRKMQAEHVELQKALVEYEDVRKMGPERLKELELEQKAKNDLKIKLPPSRAKEVKARTLELKKQLLSDPAAKLKELEAKRAAKLEALKATKGAELDQLRSAVFTGVGYKPEFDDAGKPIKPKEAPVVDPEIAKLDELIATNKAFIKENAEIEAAMTKLEKLSNMTPEQARAEALELKARKDLLPQKPVRSIDEIKKQINTYQRNLVSLGKERMTADKILRREDFARFGKQQLGSKTMKEYTAQLAAISNIEDLEKRMKAASYLQNATLGRKMLDVTHEVYINNLFSPATHPVNMLGGITTNLLKNLEMMVGSALIGDMTTVRAHFSALTTFQGFGEALEMAVLSAKTGEGVLNSATTGSFDEGRVQGGALTANTLGLNPDGAFGTAVNWLGKATRINTHLLMAGDEFLKQVLYRQFLRQQLYSEGLNKGIKNGQELTTYVEKKLNNFVLQGGKMYNEKNLFHSYNEKAKTAGLTADMGVEYDRFIAREYEKNPFDKRKSALADAAYQYSQEGTFSQDTGDAFTKGTMTVLNEHPVLKFVLPFVKTPTNILKFGLSRSPLGLAKDAVLLATSAKYREAYTTGTPEFRAELVGRMTVAATFTASISAYLMNSEGAITGHGPQNKEEKDALKSTGWQPYSIKIGDKYFSYNRLDPIATPLGIIADIAEFNKVNAPKSEEQAENAMSGLLVAMTYNLTDKSYLRGLNNLMNALRDPSTYGPKLIQDIAGGFVPNTLNQLQNTENMVIQRESRSVMDAMMRRVPGVSEELPPQRTFLGDVIYKENPLGLLNVISPIYISTKKNDIVDQEISRLMHGFALPPAKINGIADLDMRQFKNAEGKQAYDRLLELSGTTTIDGRNVRQALSMLMKSPEYKSYPSQNMEDQIGKSSPRITAINRVIKRYRNKAQVEMLGEFPELYNAIGQMTQKQKDYRLGKFENQQ